MAKAISRPLWWNSPWALVNSNKRFEPKWAWVSQFRWLVSRTPESLPSSTAAPWRSNGQEPSPLITPQWERKKKLIANRNAGASVGTQIMSRGHLPRLGFSQRSLDPGGLSPVIGDVPLFFHSEHLRILNQREGINSKNIWTIYSNTLWIVLEAGGQRAVVENGQWRHGRDSQAVHCYFFFSFFVMGCQNGFDLLRDLLIINRIICFLLCSGQEKQTQTRHQRPGQISYHQRGWLDRSWRSRLSADGS